MILREATGGDGAAVRKLVLAAFDTDEAPSIADLVDNLVVEVRVFVGEFDEGRHTVPPVCPTCA